ncbi:S-type pyocin domain-containing protein [Vibrio kasasachensis]|uniref:S-type pyocin domain-containing protein n=1 Tax=Vibrio kasasachensis TaxID=2910248 RepID=UPI003D1170F2
MQSRIRVQITEPEAENHYPIVRAYHVNDTRIPVKYVGEDNGQLSVSLEENGPTIYWTPTGKGEASWQNTPDHDDGFEKEDILVTPIHSNDEASVTTLPMPEEQDWRDAILVFPESSGIAPLYVVYKEGPRDKPGVVTGQGRDVEWQDGYWLGDAANSGQGQYIPTKIADALRGKEFKKFSDLQTAIWKEVVHHPELMEQFDKRSLTQIRNGNAPFCIRSQQSESGRRGRFEIHHVKQIQHGGEVYHIDNLRINTARNHIRIHSNAR